MTTGDLVSFLPFFRTTFRMNKRIYILCVFAFWGFIAKAQQVKLSKIEIKGAKRTKVAFVERLVGMKEGTLLDSLQMEHDVTRLKRVPSISHSYYEVFLFDSQNCEVHYIIEENFTLISFANLFSSSNDDFAFRVGLQEFNFLGRNITLGGFYQLDVYYSYGFSIRAPYLFSNKLGLAFNYNNFITQEPVFFE